MYIVRAAAQTKKNLPLMMLYTLRSALALGDLNGLIHAEDDVIRELKYGFEMISCWDTPEEVSKLCKKS